jgi:hypothetical protein
VFGVQNIFRIYQPIYTKPLFPNGRNAGLGDTLVFDLALRKVEKFTLGAGPLIVIPAASHSNMGDGKWQAGVAGSVVTLRSWGLLAAIVTYSHSFSGYGSSRPATEVVGVQPLALQFQQRLLSPIFGYLEFRLRQPQQRNPDRLRGRQGDKIAERCRNEPLHRTPTFGAPHWHWIADMADPHRRHFSVSQSDQMNKGSQIVNVNLVLAPRDYAPRRPCAWHAAKAWLSALVLQAYSSD